MTDHPLFIRANTWGHGSLSNAKSLSGSSVIELYCGMSETHSEACVRLNLIGVMDALLLGHTATQAMMWSSPVAHGFMLFISRLVCSLNNHVYCHYLFSLCDA